MDSAFDRIAVIGAGPVGTITAAFMARAGKSIFLTDVRPERIQAVRDRGTSVFLVEHDMSVIMQACDRLYVIAFGDKIAEGRPQEIQENEAVIEAYLGSQHAAA